jgi:hypothetical protein
MGSARRIGEDVQADGHRGLLLGASGVPGAMQEVHRVRSLRSSAALKPIRVPDRFSEQWC